MNIKDFHVFPFVTPNGREMSLHPQPRGQAKRRAIVEPSGAIFEHPLK
jgi:hypothetical protein